MVFLDHVQNLHIHGGKTHKDFGAHCGGGGVTRRVPSDMLASSTLALLSISAQGDATGTTCQVRNDATIIGCDILPESHHLLVPEPSGCCAACANHTACQYWVWYERMSADHGRCYLKECATHVRASAGHKSPPGVVTGQGLGMWPPPLPPPPIAPLPFDTAATVDATATARVTPFAHYWKKAFGSGHASLTLRLDWQAHLKLATEQLGLTGVRHHGLLDDDMGVVTAPGVFNFSKVLASWGYQRSLGVTPVVELSFMPAILAGCSWVDPAGDRPGHSNKTVNPGKPPCKHTGMAYHGIQELPTDWSDWYDLVKALAQAAVDAYGIEEVRTWSFVSHAREMLVPPARRSAPVTTLLLRLFIWQTRTNRSVGMSSGACHSPAPI